MLAADPAAARIEAWKADLQVLATELPKRHKDLFFKTTREAFSREVTAIETSIPTMDDSEVKVALIRLVAGVGDSHTAVNWRREEFALLPVRISRFAEGWFVTAAGEEHRAALGHRVVRLGDVDIEEAAERMRGLIPCENPSCYLARLPDYLNVLEFLRAEKVVAEDKPATLRFRPGAIPPWTPCCASRTKKLPDGGGPALAELRQGEYIDEHR